MIYTSIISDIIAIVVIILIIAGALFYIIRSKKRGQKCVGCPYCKTCSSPKNKISCCQDGSKKCHCSNEK